MWWRSSGPKPKKRDDSGKGSWGKVAQRPWKRKQNHRMNDLELTIRKEAEKHSTTEGKFLRATSGKGIRKGKEYLHSPLTTIRRVSNRARGGRLSLKNKPRKEKIFTSKEEKKKSITGGTRAEKKGGEGRNSVNLSKKKKRGKRDYEFRVNLLVSGGRGKQ